MSDSKELDLARQLVAVDGAYKSYLYVKTIHHESIDEELNNVYKRAELANSKDLVSAGYQQELLKDLDSKNREDELLIRASDWIKKIAGNLDRATEKEKEKMILPLYGFIVDIIGEGERNVFSKEVKKYGANRASHSQKVLDAYDSMMAALEEMAVKLKMVEKKGAAMTPSVDVRYLHYDDVYNAIMAEVRERAVKGKMVKKKDAQMTPSADQQAQRRKSKQDLDLGTDTTPKSSSPKSGQTSSSPKAKK